MNNNQENEVYNFDSTSLVQFTYKWKKYILFFVILGIIVSTIVSFLIDEKFKSTVILFPASSASISESLLAEHSASTKDVLKFGEEEEAEQLLQILYSYEIRDYIVNKYNLRKHYETENSDFPLTKLHKTFNDNVSFKRTEYMSVEIEVLDKDPITAAHIANDIALMIDSVMNRMRGERAQKALQIVRTEYENLVKVHNATNDSLTILRGFGINDYESQSRAMNEALGIAIINGKKVAIDAISKQLEILSKYGGAYVMLRDRHVYEVEKISKLETKLVEAEVDAGQVLSNIFIVNKAEVAEKKSYPIRWLIVVISTIATFIMSLMLLMIYDNILLKKKV